MDLLNYNWEEIESIEYLDPTDEFVYDFSVQDIETFSTKEGIVVHNTLNTFHQCGISSKSSVNQGVPRIRELLSISKKIKTPSLTIHLNNKYNDKENAKKILHEIQAINLDFFIDNTSIWYDPDIMNTRIEEDKNFVKDYYEFWNDEIDINKLSPWVLRIELNPLFLISKNITMYEIYYFLLQKYDKKNKLHIIYSDENSEHNVFHFRYIHQDINKIIETVESDNFGIPCTNQDYELLINLEQELTCNFLLKGIKDIEKVTMREIKIKELNKKTESIETKKKIVLDTSGTNLHDVLLKNEFIDIQKTISNNIHEVYEILGVEAARELLKIEIYEVLNQSGVYVNDSHLNLLVDNMTLNGGLISINRYGISKSDNGILKMASFEEPHEHFTNAAIHNLKDEMNSITSNVIMGQSCKFGTGMPELVFDIEKLIKYQQPDNSNIIKNQNKPIGSTVFLD